MRPIGILYIKRRQESFHYLMTDCKPDAGKNLVVYILSALTTECIEMAYKKSGYRYDVNIIQLIERNHEHEQYGRCVEKVFII